MSERSGHEVEGKTPVPGRSARRWLLFLLFFHLLPLPWFLFVVAGLAPASFLMAAGLASLYNTDPDSLTFALLLLGPALGGVLVCTLLAFLVAAAIGLLHSAKLRSLILALVIVVVCGIALLPIYVWGGHSSTEAYSLLDFVEVLGQFNIPAAASLGYFATLAGLLGLLFVWQHVPQRFPSLPTDPVRRRWVARAPVLGLVLLIVGSLLWTHRLLIFVYPLASVGFASVQYYLAMTLQEQSGRGAVGGVAGRGWLERAAEQGHAEAALALANTPMSLEDKLRWLTVAAEEGLPDAQYALYRLIMRNGPDDARMAVALDWLRQAASGGAAAARYELGRLLLAGSTRPKLQKDTEAARSLWQQAAAQEHGPAMEALARRLESGTDGFPRDPVRAVALLRRVAEAYRQGDLGLRESPGAADQLARRADDLADLERRVAAGEPDALAKLGRQLLDSSGATEATRFEGLALLERAAEQGDIELQYEVGAIFMFGNHGLPKDFDRGRPWWDRAAEAGHVRTMGSLAPAYRNGQYDYPVDLLRAKALTERLARAYREGFGVAPDPERARYWQAELKHFDRLFDLAGGEYLPMETLRRDAEAGAPAAQYQLGRQMLLSGVAAERKAGLDWIERAARNGLPEAQYRLVSTYENRAHIMRDDPKRGVALLEAASKQRHLPAMAMLALAYYKGNFGLPRDYRQAKSWYDDVLAVHASGDYLGEIDARFVAFQKRQLGYTEKALVIQIEREERLANASPAELEIIAIEDEYRRHYEKAVNALDRGDGTRAGKARFRGEVQRLRHYYIELREKEIAALKERG
jgi:TPR repeat protein